MNVGGPGSPIRVIVSSIGNSVAVLVHAGKLEPPVEDHRRAPSRGSARGPLRCAARSASGTIRSAMSRPIASCARVAERRLGRVVPADDAPALIHRDHGVERRLEHRAEPRLARAHLRLGVASRDELSDLAAEHAHRLEHLRIGLARLAREELHHADDARAGCAAGTRTPRAGPARRAASARGKFRVRGRVDDPGRLARLEHAAGKPFAGLEREPLAQRLEVRRARRPRATCSTHRKRASSGPASQTAPSSQPSARPIASSAAA